MEKKQANKLYRGKYVALITPSAMGKEAKYCRFKFHSAGVFYQVVCFNEEVDKAERFAVGDAVKVWGRLDGGEAEDGSQNLLASKVFFWIIEEDRAKDRESQIIEIYGSLEKYRDFLQKNDEQKLLSGLTKVKFHDGNYGWVPIEYADKFGGLLINQLMDAGGRDVIRKFREEFRDIKQVSRRVYLQALHSECKRYGVLPLGSIPGTGTVENRNGDQHNDTGECPVEISSSVDTAGPASDYLDSNDSKEEGRVSPTKEDQGPGGQGAEHLYWSDDDF